MTAEEHEALVAVIRYLEALDRADVEVDGVDPSLLRLGILVLKKVVDTIHEGA